MWKTTSSLIVQPAPPAHPTRLAHPAGRAGAGDGVCEAGERKGREQSPKGKKKIRADKNQAQKGCEREEARSRNARQKGLFRK